MPTRKKVPLLKDICIDNVARNIVWHGEKFRNCSNENIYLAYKTMQMLFTDELLKRVLLIMCNEVFPGSSLAEIRQLMFKKKVLRNPSDWPCLELLFNANTTVLLPSLNENWDCEDRMSGSFLRYISSQCKNLKKISDSFRSLAQDDLSQVLHTFQNLREVEIRYIGNKEVVRKILESCPFIRKLHVECHSWSISEEILFMLCKHCSQRKSFVLCPENGRCLEAGKCLESLQILGFNNIQNGSGVACALQHLPVLKLFQIPSRFEHGQPDVSKGIMFLQKALIDTKLPPLQLEITDLNFSGSLTPDQLQAVFMSCPKVKSVAIAFGHFDESIFSVLSHRNLEQLNFFDVTNRVLNSRELKHFFAEGGKGVKALAFSNSLEPLDMIYINSILQYCCHLEDLHFGKIEVHDRIYPHLRDSVACFSNLQKLTIMTNYDSDSISLSCREYFCNLLCDAKNARMLNITYLLAQEFSRAVEKQKFNFLEELGILSGGIGGISVQTLTSCSNLKKIKIFRNLWHYLIYHTSAECYHTSAEMWKQHFVENNYALEISVINQFCEH